ncbi:hypothetical protein FIBSPDRAFT_851485 [Athelia psychrophila]|uniref:Uncharacterized protein n=1 Tax=Athelia psychrophila TaxID=1759441 RepID=A0A166SIF8_9AGAM|nr:hypothetical protein FIBSPDRAFT_880069 [Fibularhizoctonia sp. CBS 109695]KZP02725.1 hypothetical protein FIBSPDRAFT_880066 [Fibularhizoctonia sp. CBS 109695]KZP29486.1 hypothetical protein FIBSPDRAFT_851485 [Fibularhizoctonia sp. CBS 109695]
MRRMRTGGSALMVEADGTRDDEGTEETAAKRLWYKAIRTCTCHRTLFVGSKLRL